MPRVTVIIPHFNRAELLRETLDSLARQSESSWEAIVVDDGSAPEEWRMARSSFPDPRVAWIERDRIPKGPSTCRNIGLAYASGEFILFLDSDDLLAPWCLRNRLALAKDHPEADLLVFPVLIFNQSPGDCDQLWNRLGPEDEAIPRFLRSDPPWCVTSPLWKRSALLALAGFNEQVHYGDDAELHLRALLAGLAVRQFPDALPDAFVRRSDLARTTNTISPELIESRRERLREGSRLLRQPPTASFLAVWEGQYFVEAEFLLFNIPQPAEAVDRVLDDWQRATSPGWRRRLVVRSYFALALVSKPHVYLVLRAARRLAMTLLPPDYFPTAGGGQPARANEAMMDEVRSGHPDRPAGLAQPCPGKRSGEADAGLVPIEPPLRQ